MAGYTKINGDALAYDKRVQALSSDAYRLLHFLWHGPGRTMIGLRRFDLADAVARHPGWDAGDVEKALAELIAAGLAVHDPEQSVLFTPVAMEHDPPTGGKSVKGAAKRLDDFPDSAALVPALEPILAAVTAAIAGARQDKERAELKQLKGELVDRLARINQAAGKATEAPLVGHTKGADREGRARQTDTKPEAPSMGHPEKTGHARQVKPTDSKPEAPSKGHPKENGHAGRARPADSKPEPPSKGHPGQEKRQSTKCSGVVVDNTTDGGLPPGNGCPIDGASMGHLLKAPP